MLSYQHGYHAGNFADVLKHIALTRLLAYLKLKEKAFFYLDTHAGKGLYLLNSKQAEKTGESKHGIHLLWPQRNRLPEEFNEYLQALLKLNTSNEIKQYPGSPYLAIDALRKQDRAYFCELHPREYEALNQMPHFYKRVHVRHTDGIASLNALLPPPEKRGLIFIDPSFEVKEEYKTIPAAIKQALKRFSTGIYCLWYPVVNNRSCEQLHRAMSSITDTSSLRVEFNLTPITEQGMTGCGLWILNPPFTFSQEIKAVLEVLKTCFNPGKSSYIVESY